MKNRWKVGVTVVALWAMCFVSAASAGFPEKPVTLLVPYSAGGTTDLSLRILASVAGDTLGQPVVVGNKPGGSGSVCYGILKHAKPDGYTIGGFTTSGAVVAPHMAKVPYNTKKDFTFISQFAEYFKGIAVKADAPWKTFKELIDYAKKNPGKVSYATTGATSIDALTMRMITKESGVDMIMVPYKGGHPAVAACLGGHVTAVVASELPEPVKAGQLKLLAVFNQESSEAFPGVPTIADLGIKVDSAYWGGIVGPAGIAPENAQILQDAFKKAISSKPYKQMLSKINMIPCYKSGADFKKLVFHNYDAFGKIIAELGIKKK